MFLLFLLKTCSSHLSPKRHSSSPSEHRTAEQSLSLCPQATAREGRGLRALQVHTVVLSRALQVHTVVLRRALQKNTCLY